MTSKQRVLCAFNRTAADRVPVNYMANPGIDGRLKAHFGLAANDDLGLLEALEVDFRRLPWPAYTGPQLPGCRVNPLDGIRTRWIEHSSGGYWDYCDFPLEFATEEEVAAWPLPCPDDFDFSEIQPFLKRHQSHAATFSCYGDYINGNGMLRGMEQTLVDLVTDDPAGRLLGRRRFAYQTGLLERVLHHAGGGIDIVWLGEDLGTQKGQMLSLETFRRHIRPLYLPMIELARAHGARVMVHTCGSSSWAYEDFIEMGVEAVDTLQPEAYNMGPRYLAGAFGGRLSFHGGISTAGPLAYGTTGQVRENVRETLDILMPTRSYMLAPTHDIQDNTPTENVLAMYQAARAFGRYA